MELLSLWISDSTTNASAYYCNSLDTLVILCSNAERTNNVMDIVALIKSCKLSCRCTYYLENNCDRALFSIIVSGTRSPFSSTL